MTNDSCSHASIKLSSLDAPTFHVVDTIRFTVCVVVYLPKAVSAWIYIIPRPKLFKIREEEEKKKTSEKEKCAKRREG